MDKVSVNNTDLPKWQIALAIGVPVTIGAFGLYYYYYKYSSQSKDKKCLQKEVKTSLKEENETKPKIVETPLETAEAMKNNGNKSFKEGRFDVAIEQYTDAIENCPKECFQQLSTYYQNRAAAYSQLNKLNEVISDCSSALSLNKKYVKALLRRAKAYETLEQYENALKDATVLCILEQFSNQANIVFTDNVLKQLGKTKAKELFSRDIVQIPSAPFVKNYLVSFSNDPILKSVLNLDNNMDNAYYKAATYLKNGDLTTVLDLCKSELNSFDSANHNLSTLLMATYYVLIGNVESAMSSLNTLIEKQDVDKEIKSNALIKRALLKMQLSDADAAFADLDMASTIDESNSDIYHHKGQMFLLMDKISEAVVEFKHAVSLAEDCDVAHGQKCYAEFRHAISTGDINQRNESLINFENVAKRFNNSSEILALYAQSLLDIQNFEKANEYFEKALKLQPDSGQLYVHKGLLLLNWKQNVDEALAMFQKATEIDPQCEFAYETLGSIQIQRGLFNEAILAYQKALKLSRTEEEMSHVISLLEAAKSQVYAANYLGMQLGAPEN